MTRTQTTTYDDDRRRGRVQFASLDYQPTNLLDNQDTRGCQNHWNDQIFCNTETTDYVQGMENPLVLSTDETQMDIEEALSRCDALCLENPGFKDELINKCAHANYFDVINAQ